jgi:hypothetical protein
LINNGATIVVESGATLYVEGLIDNNATGTITNNGTIEVQGDFVNAGTLTSNTNSKIIFSGNADSDVTLNGAVLEDVEMNKTSADVILMDDMAIDGDLVFLADNNHIIIGDENLLLGDAATVNVNASTTRYIETTGMGMVEKSVAINGTFTFPIGDATNYTPITSTYEGSAYAAANIRTKVNAVVHPNKPADATDFITRYWDVDATGITDYDNTLTATYAAADVTGTAAMVKGATYVGANWNYTDAATAGMTVTGSTTSDVTDFSGTNFFGKLDIKVFLQGAYNGTDMTTTLKNNNLIPLTSPYAADPVTVGSIPADVTDWVLIELRDASTPSTVLSSHSAFLKKDGTILHTDGTAMAKLKNATVTTAIAAIHHRNHLAIRTDAGLNLVNTTMHDFTAAGQAFDNGPGDPMKDVSGTFVMWGGNGNGNTNVRYGGPSNDQNYLLNTVLGGNKTLIISSTYNDADMNMNGNVRYGGPSNDQNYLLNTVLGGSKTLIINRHL